MKRLSESEETLLIETIIGTGFFKEQIRKAWSAGRSFDMESYKARSPDKGPAELPDSHLKFEEWFFRYLKTTL